ncbi:rab-GTPase-TBC domain-containing protein [Paraphysoderma sedebokerense]|nr:rab-GTPase-TBC domain-containing protein [Paraphysoderma sedebokerense]
MFITPQHLSSAHVNPLFQYIDIANNKFFSLQQQQLATSSSFLKSVAGAVTALTLSAPQDDSSSGYASKIGNNKYRIVMKCLHRKLMFVVAISESLQGISADWHYVEMNVFPKLFELEKTGQSIEQIDEYMIRIFEELSPETDETTQTHGSGNSMQKLLIKLFPNYKDEKLINYYTAIYRPNEGNPVRGHLCLSSGFVAFHNHSIDMEKTPTESITWSATYLDITSVDIRIEAKPQSQEVISIVTKAQKFDIVIPSKTEDALETLSFLCADSMKQLVEESESHHSTNATPSDLTGDLSAPTAQFARKSSFETSQETLNPTSLKRRASISSAGDLEEQKQAVHFRYLFKLPASETIIAEYSCLFLRGIENWVTGKLFVSDRFLAYQSTSQNELPDITIVIPLSEITSLKREYDLPGKGGWASLLGLLSSSSNQLVVRVKSQKLFVFAVSSMKDKKSQDAYLLILQKMRNVEFPDAFSKESARDTGTEGEENDENIPLKAGLTFLLKLEPSFSDDGIRQQWAQYLSENGNDVCLVNDKGFKEMVLHGLPEEFRSYVWMVTSGAMYSMPEKGYYERLLAEIRSKKKSIFADEIEKDVRRSLPEHPAYQSAMGVDALRRVLTAYSWRNPKLGYCQSMNIVTSFLLLMLKEADAFWLLCVIVERILPEHYTRTLVGSVIDQAAFEVLVSQHLPTLHAKFQDLYLDLSTLSVPWFVCLFLNSVPVDAGLRILDMFFLYGPRWSFMFGLAVLKRLEPDLVKCRDDEQVMNHVKKLFRNLMSDVKEEESAAGTQEQSVLNQLFVSALLDFDTITISVIEKLRNRVRLSVVQRMEENLRKFQISNLQESFKFDKSDISYIYNTFKKCQHDTDLITAQYVREEEIILQRLWNESTYQNWKKAISSLDENPNVNRLRLNQFRRFWTAVSPWRSRPIEYTNRSGLSPTYSNMPGKKKQTTYSMALPASGPTLEPSSTIPDLPMIDFVSIPFMDRLYAHCLIEDTQFMHYVRTGLDLTICMSALETVYRDTSNARIRLFFEVHDVTSDGVLSGLEFISAIESLVWLGWDKKIYWKDWYGVWERLVYSRVNIETGGEVKKETDEDRGDKDREVYQYLRNVWDFYSSLMKPFNIQKMKVITHKDSGEGNQTKSINRIESVPEESMPPLSYSTHSITVSDAPLTDSPATQTSPLAAALKDDEFLSPQDTVSNDTLTSASSVQQNSNQPIKQEIEPTGDEFDLVDGDRPPFPSLSTLPTKSSTTPPLSLNLPLPLPKPRSRSISHTTSTTSPILSPTSPSLTGLLSPPTDSIPTGTSLASTNRVQRRKSVSGNTTTIGTPTLSQSQLEANQLYFTTSIDGTIGTPGLGTPGYNVLVIPSLNKYVGFKPGQVSSNQTRDSQISQESQDSLNSKEQKEEKETKIEGSPEFLVSGFTGSVRISFNDFLLGVVSCTELIKIFEKNWNEKLFG